MTENDKNAPAPKAEPAYNHTVEQVLLMRHPFTVLAMEKLLPLANKRAGPVLEIQGLRELQEDRQRLLALSEKELIEEHAREFGSYESRQFFHRADARADFGKWTQFDTWSPDEAVALLLDSNPEVVSWSKLKGHAHQEFQFVTRYKALLQHVERAEAFASGRVKPVDVWLWAQRSGICTPPVRFTSALLHRKLISESQISDVDATDSSSQATRAPGTKWKGQLLDELRAYRELHGTKRASEHYGISETRIRELLPRAHKPKSSVFPQARKR